MPLGIDAPTTIGMALLVLGPAFVTFKQHGMDEATAAEATWHLGMAAMVVMGILKTVLSFFGDWVLRNVPRAGLLGSIAGIALVLMGFLPLIDVLRVPIVGLTCFGIVLYALVAHGAHAAAHSGCAVLDPRRRAALLRTRAVRSARPGFTRRARRNCASTCRGRRSDSSTA